MKKISNKYIYVKNPETGDYESIVGFQGESAYDAAVRLGKTNLSEEKWITEYVEKRNEAIEAIDNEGRAVLQTLPDDYIKMSSDVRQKATAISNKQSGQLIHIPNGSPQQVLSLITHIEPVQEGSGDPSPDNVRPIVGWDAVSVTGNGKNFINVPEKTATSYGVALTVQNNVVTMDGVTVIQVSNMITIGKVTLKPGRYTLSHKILSGNVNGAPTDGTVIMLDQTQYRTRYNDPEVTFTVDAEKTFNVNIMYASKGAAYDNFTFSMQLEKSDAPTDFEPFNGQTLTAALPETLYGFDKNWTTGLVTVEWEKVAISGGAVLEAGNTYRLYTTLTPKAAFKEALCDMYKMVGSYTQVTNNDMSFGINSLGQVIVHDSRYGTAADFNAALASNPIQIVYRSNDVHTIQLTPQQLSTLKGTNYIWSDVGETEVVYALDTKECVDAVYTSKASVILENISGNLITINDHIEDFPLKSLITTVIPRQEGSGDPSPVNVRPIIGWDSVSASRTRRNLLLHDAEKIVDMTLKNSSGADISRKGYLVEIPAGDYVIKSEYKEGYTSGVFTTGLIVDAGLQNHGKESLRVVNSTAVGTFKFSLEPGEKLALYNGSTSQTVSQTKTAFDKINLYIFVDDGNTENEEYNGETLTADLPETVYGGMLDWTTGVLTVTHGVRVFTGEEAGWTQYSADTPSLFYYLDEKLNGASGHNRTSECSHFAWTNGDIAAETDVQRIEINRTNAAKRWYVNSASHTTVDDFKAYLAEQYAAGTPVTLVYKLHAPYTIQLTPQQMETLKGTNNIWSNAGATEVTYAADTKIYADGKDSTAMIGTAEPGMIATKNYASGSFIVVGKSLYKATAAIATGETIAPGTNCTATTIVEQLEAIYKLLNT